MSNEIEFCKELKPKIVTIIWKVTFPEFNTIVMSKDDKPLQPREWNICSEGDAGFMSVA